MIPTEAIEKAIEGGWAPWPPVWGETVFKKLDITRAWWRNPITKRRVSIVLTKIALDPSFWQSLGKALGWATGTATDGSGTEYEWPHEWRNTAIQFYDLILTGDDTKKFWDDLLKV